MSTERQAAPPSTSSISSFADDSRDGKVYTHPGPNRRQTHVRQDSTIPFPTIEDDVDHDDILTSSDSELEDELEERRTRHSKLRRAATLSKDYTEDEERAVIRKFDRKLVFFLAFLYLLSFLDRSSKLETIFTSSCADTGRYRQCSPRRPRG